ncbi:MAG: hypothetical protein H6710_12715 [Myxococcales bacterium]|nr:hypothetical protein [Myxococcales bacterium]
MRVLASAGAGSLALTTSACIFDGHGLGTSASDSALASGEDVSGSSLGGDPTSGSSSGDASSGGVSESASSGGVSTSTSGEPTTTLPASASESSDASSSSTTEPPCDDPQTYYLDADNDTFGDPSMSVSACAPPPGYVDDMSDCDDGDGAIFPGADEVCNGADDDCDQLIDEYAPTNSGSCNSCSSQVYNGHVYLICDDTEKWDTARSRCMKVGADLVVFNDDAEFDAIWGTLSKKSGEFWVGASDRDKEGSYVWVDGSPLAVGDPHWAPGEPASDPPFTPLDCVALGGGVAQNPGRYRMVLCDPLIDRRWVCEAPL